MFARITDTDCLRVPVLDVYDLPTSLLLYILYRLAYKMKENKSYAFSYSDGDEGSVEYVIQNNDGAALSAGNQQISLEQLYQIYIDLMRWFSSSIPKKNKDDEDLEITWNGSEESGTRLRLFGLDGVKRIDIKLLLFPVHAQQQGGKWTPEVEALLKATIGSSVMTVNNEDNNKCLLYCIILGLIKLKGELREFGLSTLVVPATALEARGLYMYAGYTDELSKLITQLSKYLFPPSYSTGPLDPTAVFVEDLDKMAGTMQSVAGFREAFAEIEQKLIPTQYCGIDVYGMDFNINPHIYPLYISKNRERTVELLCVTPKDSDCSHYCLISNMETLLKRSGGKQFFSCSKCGECFYHRRLLRDHKCVKQVDPDVVPGGGGYHYSVKGVNPNIDITVGVCTKCRLCFVTDFQYQYHREHCFMQGKTGYRHVQLVTYDEKEHPMLSGEDIDMEAEDRHVLQRRVLYADFESSIDPESGVHTFMSYGVYDWDSETYECGYNIGEFIEFILDVAYSSPQEHIYVYFHNAMGYDANFVLRYILRKPEYLTWGIQVIMKSSNRLQKLVFYSHRGDESRIIHICDTFMFLTRSLERIVGSIRKDDIQQNKENFPNFFHIFHQRYPKVTNAEIDHILRKNIFPYKFFTGADKLDTPISEFLKIFEPREENLPYFSERVTLTDLEKGFADTKHVIETFKCRDAREYHDLYLCCDVMQLADVFDRSMNILWESHHIHLTRYLGMPSASWAAFLRHDPTMKIPLYEDTFFAEFFKNMIRGGITSAVLRHAVADERHSIIYLDVNGLYPYVMQAYDFPCGQFMFQPLGWTNEECAVRLYETFARLERTHKGMCFCVDMHFPQSVKELTDMYPFAPEHRRIYSEYFTDVVKKELTPYLKAWSDANDGETMQEFNGLVCTLYDKKKYNVHWRLLRFYMDHGVEIRKVWYGVSFDEGDYLAGYIRKNIAIRNERKDELGKTLYKLLGNSIYGKTFESPFKRNTYEIVRDPIKLQGLLEEGNISAIYPIDDLAWVVKMDGEDIILDKPTYIGACVCEFSKLHMYTLLYDKLMKIFPSVDGDVGCQLVYTDTDSFILRVRHPEGVGATPQELFAYIKSKDPTLIGGIGGQVKSETGEDDTIKEIIALRSKVYAYETWHGHADRRAKGTTHDAQEMQLDLETYRQVLESKKSFSTQNVMFNRSGFLISTTATERQSLSVHDGKRDLNDGIHTHAFGWKQ